MDRWFKVVWLINGFLVLAALLIGLGLLLAEQKKQAERRNRSYQRPGPQVATVVADSLVTQDVKLGLPREIGTTNLVYVEIGVKDLSKPKQETIGMNPSESVNLLICKQDGSEPRLLLDRKAFVVGVDIPSRRDTLRRFSLYRIVAEDTDGDKRLTVRDESRLYISELNGTRLSPVLPADLRCNRYKVNEEEQELILVAHEQSGNTSRTGDEREELMVFDLRTRTVRKFLGEDESIERARRILWDQ